MFFPGFRDFSSSARLVAIEASAALGWNDKTGMKIMLPQQMLGTNISSRNSMVLQLIRYYKDRINGLLIFVLSFQRSPLNLHWSQLCASLKSLKPVRPKALKVHHSLRGSEISAQAPGTPLFKATAALGWNDKTKKVECLSKAVTFCFVISKSAFWFSN